MTGRRKGRTRREEKEKKETGTKPCMCKLIPADPLLNQKPHPVRRTYPKAFVQGPLLLVAGPPKLGQGMLVVAREQGVNHLYGDNGE